LGFIFSKAAKAAVGSKSHKDFGVLFFNETGLSKTAGENRCRCNSLYS